MKKIKKQPNVVFIGAKETGKSATINRLWNITKNQFQVAEYIDGRGTISYDVQELPFISFSMERDIDSWLNDCKNIECLQQADVVVFILPIDNIAFGRKAKFIKQLREKQIISDNVSVVIGLSQIESFVDLEKIDDNYVISLSDCSALLDRKTTIYKEFSRYMSGMDFDLTNVIPFSYILKWQLQYLKNSIVEGVIKKHNELVYDKKCKTIVFIGKTGCGKSSTINTLCATELPVDGAVACTKFPIVINKEIAYNGNIKRVNIVDLPGIAESIESNIIYADYYNRYIKAADVIVCLSQANTRAYKQDEDFYLSLIESGIISPYSNIILGVNKIDLLFKTEEHLDGIDLTTISDDDVLIKDKIDDYYDKVFSSIFRKITAVSRKSVVVYSNLQKWNIEKLAEKLFSNI